MGIIEGTSGVKTTTTEWDFAKDGGAIGTKVMRGADGWDNSIPVGSVVFAGYIEVITKVTSASTNTATIALKLVNDGDIFNTTDGGSTVTVAGSPWSAAGQGDIAIDGSGSDSIRVASRTSLQMTVAVAALTAGKFRVTLLYR